MYDTDMATGTLERLEDRLADLCGHRNTLDALLVRLVAEALETGAWEMPGIVSPAHWLAWKAGLSYGARAAAGDRRQTARRVAGDVRRVRCR